MKTEGGQDKQATTTGVGPGNTTGNQGNNSRHRNFSEKYFPEECFSKNLCQKDKKIETKDDKKRQRITKKYQQNKNG